MRTIVFIVMAGDLNKSFQQKSSRRIGIISAAVRNDFDEEILAKSLVLFLEDPPVTVQQFSLTAQSPS